jgi:glyoxylase-like metal-dependent hydrolase (beta-lactamase superfamily II)
MIRVSKYGEITRYDLSRSFFGRGLYWTTAYLVDGLMIDTGCRHTAHELVNELNGLEVSKVFITHSHEDHIGGNASIQEIYPGIPTLAHSSALPVIRNPRKNQPLHLYRKIVWGMPQASQVQPLENGSVIDTGNYIFQVIWTPGHTPDHLCLYEPEQQWIFTGDLFIGGKDRAIRAGSDIWKIIASLKRIATLPLKGMYPSSARVRVEPAVDLKEKIRYLEMIGEQVLELFEQGLSERDISHKIFGEIMWIEVITGGHLSRRNLVRSYLNNSPG